MSGTRSHPDDVSKSPDFPDQTAAEEVQAWELVDSQAGRYLPRRIRGSYRGRALG